MFRLLSTLIILGCLAGGGWWVWHNVPEVQAFARKHIDTSTVHTLEARHTAEQIMARHESDLLGDAEHTFLRPTLLFSPYLMLEVKYTDAGGSTREGVMLWGLEDGEMVLDTASWQKTHGFQDCITGRASRSDFRVLSALARAGGSLSREQLSQQLHVEMDLLDQWVESCRQKKLIVQSGGAYRLHFANPRIAVQPETRLKHPLVTKPSSRAKRSARRYSKAEVELIAKAAFGNDFTIRNSKEVFLPVYSISVQNPDGTRLTSHWNALNGQRLHKSYF